MNAVKLQGLLEQTAEAIETHRKDTLPVWSGGGADLELQKAAFRLAQSVHLLLPPRLPSTTQDCPHCGHSVTVTLSE
jgi:hypothetical protein